MTVDLPRAGGPLPVGTHLRGNPAGMPACGSCSHVHRVTDSTINIDLVYDIRCPVCGCTASGDSYDRGVVDTSPVDRYQRPAERDDYDIRAVWNDDDYCGSISFPRCLPDRHRDAGAARPMVPSRDLRGGRLGGLVWSGVSKFLGDFCGQLVRERGHVGRVDRRADHGGRADTAESAGSDIVRSVVTR